jgi:hypothetical protein
MSQEVYHAEAWDGIYASWSGLSGVGSVCTKANYDFNMGRGNIQLPTYHDEEKRSSKWPWTVMIALVTGVILFSGPGVVTRNALVVPTNEDLKQACYQPEPRLPKGYNTSRILEEKERVIDWLSGAVSPDAPRCAWPPSGGSPGCGRPL